MKSMARYQQGVSVSGLLIIGILIIFGAVGLMKVMPVYMEDKTIKKVLDEIARDGDLQNALDSDIRLSFWKRGVTMNNIKAVTPEEMVIRKGPNGLALSFTYQVKVPLVANASLLFDFNPSSTTPR